MKKNAQSAVRVRQRSTLMKTRVINTRVLLAIAVLSYAPIAIAGKNAAYPSEKVAEFVVAKLDVTSLPSAFRPKKEKGKKTFSDYGLTPQSVNESEAVVEWPDGTKRLAIKVLDRKSSGIYVCVSEPEQNGSEPKTQSVLLLRRKDPDALLKGRESFREFAACPAIGGNESTADSYGD
jgi:hypothetical protein